MSLFLYSVFLAQVYRPWTPVSVSLYTTPYMSLASPSLAMITCWMWSTVMSTVLYNRPPVKQQAGLSLSSLKPQPSPSSQVSWVLFFKVSLFLYNTPCSQEITHWHLPQHSSQGGKICLSALLIMRRLSLTTLKGPEFYTNDTVFVLMTSSGPHNNRGDRK